MITGVASGFKDLDRMTSGLQPADLIIVAARPSMGKTALTLNIAQHVALHKGAPVGMFSLEMSKEQLLMRMLCAEARVDAAEAVLPEEHAAAVDLAQLAVDDRIGDAELGGLALDAHALRVVGHAHLPAGAAVAARVARVARGAEREDTAIIGRGCAHARTCALGTARSSSGCRPASLAGGLRPRA